MRIPLLFAFRYLFSKKSVNAINIISIISIVGVFVSTAALVIVLSFYNGMENFILSMYSTYSPNLRIEAAKGKTFSPETPYFKSLQKNTAIHSYSEVLEDKILSQYEGKQIVGQLKGVTPNSLKSQSAANMLHTGTFSIRQDSTDYALIGAQIQSNLQIALSPFANTIELYFPRKNASMSNVNPLEDFNIRSIEVNGMLAYEPALDNLIIVPLDFARNILNVPTNVSAIELFIKDESQVPDLQKQLRKELKDEFKVLNREEQNPTLYKTIRSEKWIVFFILTFIGIIAIFNIIGSLTMLVIDKKEDMKILQHLGASKSMIEKIFFLEGSLISLIGSTLGIIFGYGFCKLQEQTGFIKTQGMENSFLSSYPIDIRTQDFFLVFATMLILALFVSYFSSKLSVREIGNITNIKSAD